MSIEAISSNKCFGGWHKRYAHKSEVLNCNMEFAIYLPPNVSEGPPAEPAGPSLLKELR